jgi:hypothetical protein
MKLVLDNQKYTKDDFVNITNAVTKVKDEIMEKVKGRMMRINVEEGWYGVMIIIRRDHRRKGN